MTYFLNTNWRPTPNPSLRRGGTQNQTIWIWYWFIYDRMGAFFKGMKSKWIGRKVFSHLFVTIWRHSRKKHLLRCQLPSPVYIFFSFCSITMIQNVNLLYIEWLFRFLKRHTFARALARAKMYWNVFFHDFKEHYGIYIIFFNFHPNHNDFKCKYALYEIIVPVFLHHIIVRALVRAKIYWCWCFFSKKSFVISSKIKACAIYFLQNHFHFTFNS